MKRSRSSPRSEHQPRSGSSWVGRLLLGGFLFAITLWVGGRPAMRWWCSQNAGKFLMAARSEMESAEWGEAARLIGEAARIAPDDLAVVRAIADFQIRTRSHPSDVAQTLQRLSITGNADPEDIAKLARAQIDLGSHAAARKTLAALPADARSSSFKTGETEAYLLKKERRDNEADARLRAALNTGNGDAQTALKLAVLDLKQPQPDVHQRGRNSLWNMAQGNGVNASDAVRILAVDPSLTAVEVGRLLALVDGSQETNRDLHYSVMTALVHLRPSERDTLLDHETHSVASTDDAQKIAFARWLSALNENQRLLKFLLCNPGATGTSADWLQLKLQALAQTDQWDDLRMLLNRDLEKVIGTVSFNLWQARAIFQSQGDSSSMRQHLNLAFDAAARGQRTEMAVQVAETAEQLGIMDLATVFYQATATLASSPQLRIALLEKACELHLQAKNTDALLRVAVEVAKLTPGNQANSFRADYLALLVGESIELVAARMNEVQTSADSEFSSRLLLLKAMAAHRLHAPIQQFGALKKLQNLTWSAGHRAVLAAMLTAGGDEAAGFQVAEKVSTALLLPEEKRFLALAR